MIISIQISLRISLKKIREELLQKSREVLWYKSRMISQINAGMNSEWNSWKNTYKNLGRNSRTNHNRTCQQSRIYLLNISWITITEISGKPLGVNPEVTVEHDPRGTVGAILRNPLEDNPEKNSHDFRTPLYQSMASTEHCFFSASAPRRKHPKNKHTQPSPSPSSAGIYGLVVICFMCGSPFSYHLRCIQSSPRQILTIRCSEVGLFIDVIAHTTVTATAC